MNVIVSNKQKEILDNANIDAIKDLNGLFNVEELINNFKNYFFSKMVIDATSIVDFTKVEILKKLVEGIGAEKLVILLPPKPEPPKEFLDCLVKLGIYNFSTNVLDVVKYLQTPNTYEDVLNLLNGGVVNSSNGLYFDNSITVNDNTQNSQNTLMSDNSGSYSSDVFAQQEIIATGDNQNVNINVNNGAQMQPIFNEDNVLNEESNETSISVSNDSSGNNLSDFSKPSSNVLDNTNQNANNNIMNQMNNGMNNNSYNNQMVNQGMNFNNQMPNNMMNQMNNGMNSNINGNISNNPFDVQMVNQGMNPNNQMPNNMMNQMNNSMNSNMNGNISNNPFDVRMANQGSQVPNNMMSQMSNGMNNNSFNNQMVNQGMNSNNQMPNNMMNQMNNGMNNNLFNNQVMNSNNQGFSNSQNDVFVNNTPITTDSSTPQNKRQIIGFKNITSHAGSTSLIFMLKQMLELKFNKKVIAVEIEKNDFSYYHNENMINLSLNSAYGAINNYQADVILVDLNDSNLDNLCTDVVYLIEPSIIKLNSLMAHNSAIFTALHNKKVVLNRSVLSNNDINTFAKEAKINFFFNIPCLNDRVANSVLEEFLKKLDLIDTGKHGLFGVFK